MKLYRFDGVDERLELVPLGARRALDRAGMLCGCTTPSCTVRLPTSRSTKK